MTLRQMLRELWAGGPGRIGLILLLVLVTLSIYAVFRFPPGFGTSRWSNPAIWADNPKAAPPIWANLISTREAMPHTRLTARQPSEVLTGGTTQQTVYRLPMAFGADEPPTFITFTVAGITYHSQPPVLTIGVGRPDGTEIILDRVVTPGPRPEEAAPFKRYHQEPFRTTLTADPQTAETLREFFTDEYGVELPLSQLLNATSRAVVGTPDPGELDGFRLLHGSYKFTVTVTTSDPRDQVERVEFVAGGSLFGLMGTDHIGRDLASGLLAGLPVALFIGVMASVTTTLIGATLGVISGYAGGKTDLVIQRMSDIVGNAPVLPLLIFLVFILEPNLFLIILLLVAFSWPGLTILVRSMVLQIRSGQLVESAVVVGASQWRIMFRYLFPQTAPFVFAQMIFFTPAAILAEAGLSFLGLGDTSIPTWGQILAEGFTTGAVFLGWWWWVIPPGVLIVITAVTFMLLALGMEPLVNPRLRRAAPAVRAQQLGQQARIDR